LKLAQLTAQQRAEADVVFAEEVERRVGHGMHRVVAKVS
jgi:hypothetical protein